MNPAAVHRWLMSQSERAAITSQCKSMAGMLCMPRFVHLCINIHFWTHDQFFNSTENQTLYQFNSYRKRKDLDTSKCERYEKSVQDVMATVAQMINPFEADQEELVSLATGAVLENDVADSLLRAEEIGEEQFQTFVKKNLLSEEPDIFTTLKKNKLPTFSSAKNATVKDSKGKEITVKMNRNFFARLLILAKSRQIDLEEVLSYSLGVYPLSLATASGTFVKTAKSKLFEIL